MFGNLGNMFLWCIEYLLIEDDTQYQQWHKWSTWGAQVRAGRGEYEWVKWLHLALYTILSSLAGDDTGTVARSQHPCCIQQHGVQNQLNLPRNWQGQILQSPWTERWFHVRWSVCGINPCSRWGTTIEAACTMIKSGTPMSLTEEVTSRDLDVLINSW